MKYLLDTHLLLWAASEPDKLSKSAKQIIQSTENILLFSAASMWEITIKNSLGRKDFTVDARLLKRGLLDNGYQELPITSHHAIAVNRLPTIHKDPFDRILIAQASVEGFILLTSDSIVAQYDGAITHV